MEERVNLTMFEEISTEQLDELNVPKRAISLMWSQRSVDTLLGLPFNIASYATLLEILAKEVNMVPDELIGNLGDCHIYSNHIEQVKEAMFESGAGKIGNYDKACWQTLGQGQFRSLVGAKPFIGAIGETTYVPEYKVEMVCPLALKDDCIQAMLKAHPYEEAAYYIQPLAL